LESVALSPSAKKYMFLEHISLARIIFYFITFNGFKEALGFQMKKLFIGILGGFHFISYRVFEFKSQKTLCLFGLVYRISLRFNTLFTFVMHFSMVIPIYHLLRISRGRGLLSLFCYYFVIFY